MNLYHASTTLITDLTASNDICLARQAGEALPYLEAYGQDGHLHLITLSDSALIADEDDAEEIIEALGYEDDGYLWVSLDREDVRAALAAEGYDGVESEDQGPDSSYEHQTIRIWSTDKLSMITTMPITC